MSLLSTVRYLKSLPAVRHRSQSVYALAEQAQLRHFTLDASKIPTIAALVLQLIQRDHGTVSQVPTHGRWRSYITHSPGPGTSRDLISEHIAKWQAAGVDSWECARRVIDLFVVSVLIDAGAGSAWEYQDAEIGALTRTEGLGMAALRMFETGCFSSSREGNVFQADAEALKALANEDVLQGFQVSESNPLLGVSNRAELLRRLGMALEQGKYFKNPQEGGVDAPARPGFMLDYLASLHPSAADNQEDRREVDIEEIWEVIIEGFAPVWPSSRTQLGGESLGDVWPCPTLQPTATIVDSPTLSVDPSILVPFHKLSQWLTWSLLEVIVRLGGFTVTRTELLTGLPEYRNGGLFVDLGVLTLNDSDRKRGLEHPLATGGVPLFDGSDPVIVEWRALTVCLLDRVAEIIKKECCAGGEVPEMFLGRILEGGTWKAGREVAAEKRPLSKDPPINIVSDGTLF
ncbi:hypothetical protein BX661DRAFT_140103 [Kickxella alabastrina]|uniref:uncharacterized protein n=1 Tax=Kickxella alabastrina TaxID=61397 RepID=UPI002220805C|nr:uncharacterized protein BX661DRAFT_140103 [Kickxella alabastrina]KAI7834071.1 hypothetical protein BX661DRAFT_140103 [Kickxella alabastrina]